MKKSVFTILFVAVSLLAFIACEDEGNETKISSYNSDDSHKNGQDCMVCHVSGGSGEGWFTIAGSVAPSLSSIAVQQTTVKLYSGANGTGDLIATIEVDEKGNFYTTKKYDFGTGLYPQVIRNTTTQNMISSITAGNCNSCHGANNPILAE